MSYDFVCLGDAVYDIFIKPHEAEVLESCKKSAMRVVCEPMLCMGYGEKISIEKAVTSVGGSAANVAVGLARLGLKTSIITEIGSDNAAEEIEKKLEKAGVNLDHLQRTGGQNSFSVVLMHKGERTILVYRGIKDYSRFKIGKNLKTKWLYVSAFGDQYEKVYRQITASVSERGVKLALNPGKRQLEEKRPEFMLLLKLCEVLILNKQEAEMLVGARFPLEPKEIFFKLSELGAKINVVTNGKGGAYVRGQEGDIYKIDKFSDVESVEATGAGDAFSAGFLHQLYNANKTTNVGEYVANDIKKALICGVINGAKATEKVGAQSGLQTKNQLEKLVKDAPRAYKIN